MKFNASILALWLTVGLLSAQTTQPPATTEQATNMVANGVYISPSTLGDFYTAIVVPNLGGSGFATNYTGVVTLTNRANVFGGVSFTGYGQSVSDYPFIATNAVYGNNRGRYFYAYYRGFGVVGTNNGYGDNFVACDVDSGGFGNIAIGCGANGVIYLGNGAGNATFPHDVTAATFTGDGSALTGYASSLGAGSADYATSAGSAGYADSAGSADFASQKFDDFFYNYQSAGTAGQYLVSDGAGNGVWTTSGGDLPPWIYSTYGSSNSIDMSSVAGAPSIDMYIGSVGYLEGEPYLRLALASGAIQYNFMCRHSGTAIPFHFGSGISSSTEIFRPSSTTFQIDSGGSAEIAISTTGVVSINGLIQKPNVEISSATSGTVTATTTYWNDTVYLSSGSTITSITVALPSSTSVGQTFCIHSKSIVTAITVSGGSYLDSAVTSLIAGQTIKYQATTTGGAYIRIQ